MILWPYSTSFIYAALGDEFWDSTFGTPGVDGAVYSIAIQGSNVFFGGTFHSAGGVVADNIARWDGGRWDALGSGVNGGVKALAVCGGDLYVGGSFTAAGGVSATNVAKWDGTNWSALSAGTDGPVTHIAEGGSNVFFGGDFSYAGGIRATNLARWDGTQWAAVDWARIRPTALAADSANLFASDGGIVRRWTGSNWVSCGSPSFTKDVLALAEGRLYAAGSDGSGPSCVALWLGGSQWSYIGQMTVWCDPHVCDQHRGLVVNGSEIYAGGEGYFPGGGSHSVVRWDGSNWLRLERPFSRLWALACNGSELFVGSYSGSTNGNVALWHIPYTLRFSRAANTLIFSWPATGTNFVLETCSSASANEWMEVTPPPTIVEGQLVVPHVVSGRSQFFRLRRR